MSLIMGWKELREVVKRGNSSINYWIAYQGFPRPIIVRFIKGARRAWVRTEVEAWLRQRGFDQ